MDKHYLLSGDDYGYVFSYELNNEAIIHIESIPEIVEEVAERHQISGKIEVYAKDGFIKVEQPNPITMSVRVTQDPGDGRRLFRIGIGLNIEREKELINQIKSSLTTKFADLVTGTRNSEVMSEAATVGSIRFSIEPIVFFTFQAGKERSVTRMIYNFG